MSEIEANHETDPRFPSGLWYGFFLQAALPGRHKMELHLTFRCGDLRGSGRDWVGPFLVLGRYDCESGECHWTKRYLDKHDVFYKGYNEGKGIWGTWEIPGVSDPDLGRGGFHIWPEGMPDPTEPRRATAEELKSPEPQLTVDDPALAGVP